ncbi:hypothetical protein Hte_003183 [Hypoxylon texense]
MWDHVTFGPSYAVDLITHSSLSNPNFAARQADLYRSNRTGMLTNPAGDILGKLKHPFYPRRTELTSSAAFARFPDGCISKSTRAELDSFSTDWPDYEHLFLDGYFGYGYDLSDGPADGRNYVSSAMALAHPFSRGNVSIVSNDTSDYPLVSPNWLQDKRDQEVAIAAYKRARAVFTSDATSEVILGNEVFPGLNVSTDQEILSPIRESAFSSYNAASTCAVGLSTDPMAVLDSAGKVYGVDRLRVVDASSFPVLPPSHPTATVCKKLLHY